MKNILLICLIALLAGCNKSQTIDLHKKVNDINKTTPVKVDECSTLFLVTYIGKTVQYNFEIEDECISLIDQDEYKRVVINNILHSDTDWAIKYFIDNDICFNHALYDSRKNLKCIIKISPNDLKRAYNDR